MTILIVEDNPINARLLVLMLQAAGYQTVAARNGIEALATLSGTAGIQLIITDYMMPEMDGLEFIERVRALPAFNAIPILVASAHADLGTVKRVQGLQCDGFVVKPIDKQDLLKRVEQVLRSQPQVLLDKRKIMERLDLGLDQYNDLIKAFAAQLAEALPTVVLEQGDVDEPISDNLDRRLKALAESAAVLGADQFALLYSKCLGRSLPARSQCAALLKALQELEMALRAYLQTEPNLVPQR